MSKNNLLQPSIVFDCFAEVKIKFPIFKKEEKMIAFLKAFGEAGSAHKSGRKRATCACTNLLLRATKTAKQ